MTVQHDYRRVMDVFDEVCDLPQAQQTEAISRLCGDDTSLQLAVQRMLEHDRQGLRTVVRDRDRGVEPALSQRELDQRGDVGVVFDQQDDPITHESTFCARESTARSVWSRASRRPMPSRAGSR